MGRTVVAVGVAALLAGFGLGRLLPVPPSGDAGLTEASAPSQAAPTGEAPVRLPPTTGGPVEDPAAGAHAPAAAPPSAAPGPELLTAAMLQRARAEFIEAWRAKRATDPSEQDIAEGLKTFRDLMRAQPARLGSLAGHAANQRDALQTALAAGDGVAVIQAMRDGTFHPEAGFLRSDRFTAMFAPRTNGATYDVLRGQPRNDKSGDGVTVRFGPGVHPLGTLGLSYADMVIEGAGMNQTLLRTGDMSVDAPVQRITYRNCTLDCNNDGLFDLRRAPAVVTMEHVRIVRFDAGHGGCTIFDGRGWVLRATDCEIAGGYGSAPGMGDLIRGGPVLARFVRCTLDAVQMSHWPSGLVEFEHCTFRNLNAWSLRNPPAHVQLHDCTLPVERREAGDFEGLAKNLTDLFPEFRGR